MNQGVVSVWLVEDDGGFRVALESVVSRAPGLACMRTFERCEDMITALTDDFAPDVVLMDIVLPGMSGIEGTTKLRELVPGTQVIVLTNYMEDDKVFGAICAGASGYLVKSAPSGEIISAIREVMRGGAPMNAQIARRVLDLFVKLSVPTESYGLTKREKEILSLMTDGLTKAKIAEHLYISYYTVDTHLKSIYAKLHVHTRSGAVGKALKEHLI